jgi:hypothetical protein
MIKLLVIIVTKHTPQNRVSDTMTHVTLKTINGVISVHTAKYDIT